jgi:acetyl-CoA acetyltransferase family protein
MIAEKWGITREEVDGYGYDSHMRAARATDEHRFDGQLVPIEVKMDDGSVTTVTRDEGIRPDTTMEVLAGLRPVFKDDGVVTAGNSSQITDGASAILIMADDKASELGFTPKARFVSFSLAGTDPVLMLTGPIPATEKALAKAGLTIDDIDLFEVNEAFACVIGAWLRETGADWEKTNVNGGAIALGHPLGASGARLMTTMVHELERTGGRYGLQTMCEGGGLANGTIIELL